MESCLGELHLNWCIIYLDDIIIHSRTPEEHLIRLEGVFQRLRAAGLKLKPSKCAFFRDRIAYLGHIVSKEGIEVDPSKITAIQKWPRPNIVTDVRSFLGFTNYYRKFMHQYAQISKPLNDLTSGENAKRKNKTVEWTEEHQKSFDHLKDLSTKSPILAYANYKKPFIVYTDVSEKGLGAMYSLKYKRMAKKVQLHLPAVVCQSQRNGMTRTNWSSWPLNGPSLIVFMSTCMGESLTFIRIIIH